jgi:hypothetical protein
MKKRWPADQLARLISDIERNLANHADLESSIMSRPARVDTVHHAVIRNSE